MRVKDIAGVLENIDAIRGMDCVLYEMARSLNLWQGFHRPWG